MANGCGEWLNSSTYVNQCRGNSRWKCAGVEEDKDMKEEKNEENEALALVD